ncbi:class I SAM-dependent methyltransferase [Ferruginibacter sp. SUN106]|uniref:class I SAM-dependent methyltransferase n=1 Tax=Ferruginibacter sp. SUN106 TaxID=2978348 RepID=UPI003D369F83
MKDNFSKQAAGYAKYRPQYPETLFTYIVDFVKEKNTAWDCGTGNGQTAAALSKYFNTVIATDISQQQIDNAYQANNIFYSLQPAEQTHLANKSIDLITVSQALHWFNFEQFYAEVNRVAKPGAVIAVWTYSLLQITPAIDAIIHHYHFNTLANYWDAERKYVDDNYASVPFPFEEENTPPFVIQLNWSLKDLEGYFYTWSALQKFITANSYSPVDALMEQIKPLWGAEEKREIIFPVHLRLGTIK